MDPSLVISKIERLPDDSMTIALMRGSKEFFGWGTDRYLSADIYDALNVNTVATGNWKKGKTPDLPPWPRPKPKVQKPKSDGPRIVSIKELHAQFRAAQLRK